jgi:hypothetical protein
MALALVVLALGYRVVSNYSSSPRPAPLETGSAGQPEPRKVELRLWQDPFEAFDASTNESSSAKSTDRPRTGSLDTSDSPPDDSLSNDIQKHIDAAGTNTPTAIMGVMLEGGSYAEDKEVRLRLRYAVELALLTGEMGPEDRTHISTNSITLDGEPSDFAFEWFQSRSDSASRQALVLWLKEDDFSDNPAQRLNSLVAQIPQLTNSDKKVSFFLIGPRSSDSLRALNWTLNTRVAPSLIAAAVAGNFKILSPEATAMIHDATNNQFSGHRSSWRASWDIPPSAITDLPGIVQRWTNGADFPSSLLWSNLSAAEKNELLNYAPSNPDRVQNIVWNALNRTIDTNNLSDAKRFPRNLLPPETTNVASQIAGELDVRHFNGFVLERAYSNSLSVNRASDPYGRKLQYEFDAKFEQTNVFHTWIANDQRLAELIAEEIKNRIAGPLEKKSNNVVVILSEQDTYFGSRLANEWIDALVGNGVCHTNKNIWEFAYLRGLDGSKPAVDKTPAKQPDPSESPEDAIRTAEAEQQHNNLKADGNAQMDYIARLGDMLHTRDLQMKNRGSGRIIAVGLTGSDSYDKLILLREISRRLPEAVFFTTDLDAPLWTANVLPCSRNLLVASAFPVEPNPKNNDWPTLEEFPPFRDVYQAAVFHACNAVVTNLWGDSLSNTDYNVPIRLLKGSLWTIGRRGPVRLRPVSSSPPSEAASEQTVLITPAPTVFGLLAFGLIVTGLGASSRAGVRQPVWRKAAPASTENQPGPDKTQPTGCKGTHIEIASQSASGRQLSFSTFLLCVGAPLLVGALAGAFLWHAWRISQTPGEEPWDFFDGVSIWPSECLRFIAFLGCLGFLWFLNHRLIHHRKKLWRLYFAKHGACWQEEWDEFRKKQRKQSNVSWNPFSSQNWLLAPWTPPFVETTVNRKNEAAVDIAALFDSYLRFGDFRYRLFRVALSVILYLVIASCLVSALHDVPTWLLVRGHHSHLFDRWVLLPSAVLVLVVLFYMLDAALLTKRVLNCISLHPSRWPDRPLVRRAADFSVKPEHLDGFFDVEFAAIQTQEVGLWMFGPFLFLMLLLISRSALLDNWTWPLSLKIIFAVNFILGAACWFVVRRSAQKVRQLALERIESAKSSVKGSDQNTIQILLSENKAEDSTTEISEILVPKKDYLDNLDSVRQAILDEDRGAFARAFQDPSYLGVGIPSGISGLISLIPFWFGR